MQPTTNKACSDADPPRNRSAPRSARRDRGSVLARLICIPAPLHLSTLYAPGNIRAFFFGAGRNEHGLHPISQKPAIPLPAYPPCELAREAATSSELPAAGGDELATASTLGQNFAALASLAKQFASLTGAYGAGKSKVKGINRQVSLSSPQTRSKLLATATATTVRFTSLRSRLATLRCARRKKHYRLRGE